MSYEPSVQHIRLPLFVKVLTPYSRLPAILLKYCFRPSVSERNNFKMLWYYKAAYYNFVHKQWDWRIIDEEEIGDSILEQITIEEAATHSSREVRGELKHFDFETRTLICEASNES